MGEGDASVATPKDSTTCTRMYNSIITFINCFVFLEMLSIVRQSVVCLVRSRRW